MAQKGKDLNIAYSTTNPASGGTYTPLGLARQASLNEGREMVEYSNPSTGTGRTYMPGKKDWTMSCGCLLSSDVTTLQTAYNSATLLYVAMRDSSSHKQWRGTAYIKRLKVVGNVKEMAQISIELQGTGSIIYDSYT